jgi:hypothetical protein
MRASDNPFLCGQKAGNDKPFEMNPCYLLGDHDGCRRWLLLATRTHPFYDFCPPLRERVLGLLREDAPFAALSASRDFGDHERPRAAELLADEQEKRSSAAAEQARRLETASLVSADLDDVRCRLTALNSNPYENLESQLVEWLDGLTSSPTNEGRCLIADALWQRVNYYKKWADLEDHAEELRKALDGIDSGPAEALVRGLSSRFSPKETEDAELLSLLGQ